MYARARAPVSHARLREKARRYELLGSVDWHWMVAAIEWTVSSTWRASEVLVEVRVNRGS